MRRYTPDMDGRTAAMNVLMGVMIGFCVPIIGAAVLTRSHPDFEWVDHVFTIFMLCIACGAIGAFINLPWQGITEAEYRPHVVDTQEPMNEQASGAAAHERGDTSTNQRESHRGAQREVPAAGKQYAMSRREALKTLDLEHDADEAAVRDAFRRMALVHHPDHVATRGEDAIAAATAKFQQIRAAYDVLVDDVA